MTGLKTDFLRWVKTTLKNPSGPEQNNSRVEKSQENRINALTGILVSHRNKIKIKEGTETVSDETFKEKLKREETITERIIVEIIQTMTTDIIFFKVLISEVLKRQ